MLLGPDYGDNVDRAKEPFSTDIKAATSLFYGYMQEEYGRIGAQLSAEKTTVGSTCIYLNELLISGLSVKK
eukprot:4643099-Amphidinium_carterae.1